MTASRALRLAAALLLVVAPLRPGMAFPVSGDHSVFPAGTELNEDAAEQPRELFATEENGGERSYLVDLGDMAFSAPTLFGGAARRAGMSCSTCHVNGANNPKLFVPGLSTRPGNFDTTSQLFNPKADNGVLDPVTTPSLRGARYLAPYGHDGRMASLRDFVRNVIVNEFAGPEPSPTILDALVAYIQDIDFLPNPKLGPDGRLAAGASDAERRGEALFSKPFPHDPSLSCAACHVPSAAFVDHLQHDVGSGGLYKTPTLRNADFNAPYFHDGRYDTYDQVVGHFDRLYDLRLSAQDRQDLVAYLTAIGDGERPYEPVGLAAQLSEVDHFAKVLDRAVPAHESDIVALSVDTIGGELRELVEDFPDRKDTAVTGGRKERMKARATLEELVLALRQVEIADAAGDITAATAALAEYHRGMAAAVPTLEAAVPWSLFEPSIRKAHYAALRQLVQLAGHSAP